MHCPKCQSAVFTKAGYVSTNQRYRCKSCGYHFTKHPPRTSPELKRIAIHLYLEGLSLKKISQVTEISDVAIGNWIRPLQPSLASIRKSNCKIKQLHKIEHFMISRNLFNEFGWLIVGFEKNSGINLLGSQQLGNCKLESE